MHNQSFSGIFCIFRTLHFFFKVYFKYVNFMTCFRKPFFNKYKVTERSVIFLNINIINNIPKLSKIYFLIFNTYQKILIEVGYLCWIMNCQNMWKLWSSILLQIVYFTYIKFWNRNKLWIYDSKIYLLFCNKCIYEKKKLFYIIDLGCCNNDKRKRKICPLKW